jgi:hypothetical protein
MLDPAMLASSAFFFRFLVFPPAPLMTELVATLSIEGEREYRGDPTPSVSGEKALRSCEGLRFLVCAEDSEEMLPRFLGIVNDGMCGGEAMAAG